MYQLLFHNHRQTIFSSGKSNASELIIITRSSEGKIDHSKTGVYRKNNNQLGFKQKSLGTLRALHLRIYCYGDDMSIFSSNVIKIMI